MRVPINESAPFYADTILLAIWFLCARNLKGSKESNHIAYYYHKELIDSIMADKFCECCGKPLVRWQKKFCSCSCAAKVNNLKRGGDMHCKHCGKILPKGNRKHPFCSPRCQHDFAYSQRVQLWLSGEEIAKTGAWGAIPKFIKRYLFEKYHSKCCICGWGDQPNHWNYSIGNWSHRW